MTPSLLPAECIILAAGASSRMGAFKPLLPWGEGSVLSATVGHALSACRKVHVVLGCRAGELRSELVARFPGPAWSGQLSLLMNPDWEKGQTGSLKTGMGEVKSLLFFVMLADMPLVPQSVYRSLYEHASVLYSSGILRACAPRNTGQTDDPLQPGQPEQPGHPVLIPRSWIPELSRLGPDTRLRPTLMKLGLDTVPVACPGVSLDLDTLPDYELNRPRAIDIQPSDP